MPDPGRVDQSQSTSRYRAEDLILELMNARAAGDTGERTAL